MGNGKVPELLAASTNRFDGKPNYLEPTGLLVDELIMGTLRGEYKWASEPGKAPGSVQWRTTLAGGRKLILSGWYLCLEGQTNLDLSMRLGTDNAARLLVMLLNLEYYLAVFQVEDTAEDL